VANVLSQSRSFMAESVSVRRSGMYQLRLLVFFLVFIWMQAPTLSVRAVALAFASALGATGMMFFLEFIRRHERAHLVFLIALLAIVIAIALYGIQKRQHFNTNEAGPKIQSPAS